MKKNKTLLLLFLVFINLDIFSQIHPSIYTGWGFDTNLGGEVGLGTEIRYKFISMNAAVGSWTGDFPNHTGDKSRFDYDFGIKIYSEIGFFLGVNYGVINESFNTKTGQSLTYFEKTHGFSFTGGYRFEIYKSFYCLSYIGFTSDKESNYTYNLIVSPNLNDPDKHFIPHLGLIIGYEFNHR